MTKPNIIREELQNLIEPFAVDFPVKVVGLRGYYKKSMGDATKNDRNIYDDCICIIAPDYFAAFNANTDPSVFRKGVATLKAGVYFYKPGLHGVSGPKPYPAFRQDSDVTVLRDGGTKSETDSPAKRFWINIHRGGFNTTSSLGCQTIHPFQWEEFHKNVNEQLKKYKQTRFPYILVEL